MRPSKRLAAGVLAAVLALSMTACNPPQQPPASNSTGNNSSTSIPSASSGSNSSSSEASSSINSQNQATAVSRTDKYFKRLGVGVGKSYYYELEAVSGPRQGVVEIMTSDGRRVAEKGSGKRVLGIVTEYGHNLKIYDRKTKIIYEVWNESINSFSNEIEKKVVMWKNEEVEDGWPIVPTGMQTFNTMYTVNGVKYYAEGITPENQTYFYCFDIDDTEGMNLKFIVEDKGKYQTNVYKFKVIQSQAKMDMLRIPEGYKIYKGYSSTGTVTSKDTYPN